ncbi:fucolectin-1-like [Chanodichthys erythropterus]|uniref:fucolectin-1-like n=1 Tax=Chanodichthys erythropterus TaxID=933992 RepID=UPI00351DC6FC
MNVLVILLLALLPGLCVTDWTEDTEDISRNIALGAKTVQSSTDSFLGSAKHAVDGNSNSNYAHGSCTHTNSEHNPWWRVDLMGVYSINKVTIANRGDCCGERISGAQIRIGNSLHSNGNNNHLAAVVWSIPSGGTETYKFKPIEGRYVNIVLPGMYKILTLCEVEVFAETEDSTCVPGNLAVGGQAVQSSTSPTFGETYAKAQHAVDGNTDTDIFHKSCSHTARQDTPWWRVDLKNVYTISKVAITTHRHCCSAGLSKAQIRIGNSLENNGNNNQLAATVWDIGFGVTKTFEFKPIKGRYVNIAIPDAYHRVVVLCEVQVFCR